jgi:hypothetical protein
VAIHLHVHGAQRRRKRTGDEVKHDPHTGQFTTGTHVKINAPGTAGHGREGYVHNRPSAAGGTHEVMTPTGESFRHGANELRATGRPPLSISPNNRGRRRR